MAGDENFYGGADYGLDSEQGELYKDLNAGYRFPTSTFGLPTDPRTANQLKAVSDKLNTGAKVIEVSGVTPGEWETLPTQHIAEINRLRKLAGVDLTFHGPIIEPTGVTKQGWNETHREMAERQMFSAVERAQKLDPKGNVVITFHASASLPEPETRIFNPKTKKEEIQEFWTIDQRTGQMSPLKANKDYLTGAELNPKDTIKKHNKETWYRALQGVNYHAAQGASIIREPITDAKGGKINELTDFYKKYNENPEQAEKDMESLGPTGEFLKGKMRQLLHGDVYLRDAYQELQTLFNQAYDAAERSKDESSLKRLNEYKNELAPKLKNIEDPSNLIEFSDEIQKGVRILRSLDKPPEILRPLKDFGIEKASETFGNVAFDAYSKFKENAPIISVENPPIGMGIARADDLREVVKKARIQFEERAKEKGMSKEEAKQWSEKLIGATWDVGHINMVRKYGYGVEELKKETETIAPYVKHIHLSDNFGLEHTELPMGMGNVPLKEHLAKLKEQYGDKLKKIKQVIETGNWFKDFKTTPFNETLRAFGSPIYGMAMSPYWNQGSGLSGNYFAGYGQTLPEQHFSMYGAGFSMLPTELGGQMSGRNRLSGAPME